MADRLGKGGDSSQYLRDLERLQSLRHFAGEPPRFWSAFLQVLLSIAGATDAMVMVRNERQAGGWKVVAVAPRDPEARTRHEQLVERSMQRLDQAARECRDQGASLWENDGSELAAVELATGSDGDSCLAVLLLGSRRAAGRQELVRRLRLAADVPAGYQLNRIAAESKTRVEHFASVLDLMELVNAEKRFLAAAMIFCNELAARHRCERVSLGWLSKGYIRLQAISHVDDFDKKAESVRMLEAAMEESLDQDTEVIVPALDEQAVSREHQAFARHNDVAFICSLPLRVDGEPTAVCTCERSSEPFSALELRLLRLSCDQAARRLGDLKRHDRWFGARLAGSIREGLARLVGYEHTGAKVLVVLAAALIALTVFGPFPYRLKAPAILRTDDVAYLTAPFDGHIEKVHVRVGDVVQEGQELLGLDQSQLLLREAELIAEKNRYLSEEEKARASFAAADMRISRALYEQASARHDLVRHQLEQSTIRAPFAGVIVEGDLMERVGSPVRQADVLFKLARIERLYAELQIAEADVHELHPEITGQIAFASRPQDHYRIRMFRMEPVAVPKEAGNVFIVHCNFPDGLQEWWRPGMTGVARLDAGERRLIWLLTHRTADFLRLRLWW